jgi:sortase B
MFIRRICCLILAAMMTCGALAEPAEATMEPETVHEIVQAMFAAAAGTDTETEKALREEMTEDECMARNQENALYRERTFEWLKAAFAGETVEPETTPEPDAAPGEQWTAEDGYAAFSEREQGKAFLELLDGLGAQDMESALALTRLACESWLAEIDGAALEEMNPDYSCWIFCPDSQIDYPVVHGEDNSFYLHRMFNGDYNSCGTLFMDYRNLPDFQDPNTLIYGHHMRNGSMFKSITYYAEQSYYEAHPFMLIVAPAEISVVAMFAGYTTDKRDHCYDIAISDEEDMRAFVAEAMEKSDFVSETVIEPGDRLVTLSTCAYAFENARYIAIGKLCPVWTAQEDALDGEN